MDITFLRMYPTTQIESAIAYFKLRPRASGYTRPGLVQRFPKQGTIAGYATTCVIATDEGSMHGSRESFEYWNYVSHVGGPKLAVILDSDSAPGSGAALGHVGANVHKALGCEAVLTNGGVRDLDEIAPLGLQVYSTHLTIGHAFPHIVNFGVPVVF